MCQFTHLLANTYAIWIPELGFETILCGLVLFRGYETYKAEILFRDRGRLLLEIIIRDSVLYFLL